MGLKRTAYRKSRKQISDLGRFMIISLHFLSVMSMQEAIVISYLMMYGEMQETENRTNGMWFKCPHERLGNVLNLTRHQQDLVLKKLETKKFVKRKMTGNPARRWIRINFKTLDKAIDKTL